MSSFSPLLSPTSSSYISRRQLLRPNLFTFLILFLYLISIFKLKNVSANFGVAPTRNIAAFFGQDANSQYAEKVFNYSRKIQLSPNPNNRFSSSPYTMSHFSANDSFDLAISLCRTFKQGVSAVFSLVSNDVTTQTIDSFIRAFEVPHITFTSRHVVRPIRNPGLGGSSVKWGESPTPVISNTFQLMPHIEKAVFDYMFYNNWTSAVVFYDDDTVNDNFRYYSTQYMRKEMAMEVKHVTSRATARRYLLEYQKAGRDSKQGGLNFLLLTTAKTTYMIVKLAEDLQMLNHFNKYLIADLRVSCDEMHLSSTGKINVFCFRNVMLAKEKMSKNFTKFSNELNRLLEVIAYQNPQSDNSSSLTQLEIALLADFHKIISEIYDNPTVSSALDNYDPRKRSYQNPAFATTKPCLDYDIMPMPGFIIASELRSLKMLGFSGNIEFDSNGLRKNFKLDIVEAKRANTRVADVVATWDDIEGYRVANPSKVSDNVISSADSVIRVVTIVTEPFTMWKKGKENAQTGVENFEGFCIDMLKEIAAEINMTFELHLVRDGKYGEELKNGSWNGMIGELMRGQADIAVAPLTISSERQRVVDFTKPYMDVGVSIMMKFQEKEKNIFSFMVPLQTDIWMCIILSYVSVSVVYFVVSRISLIAWMKAELREEKEENFKYTLSNCFFLTLGAVLQRGEDMCTKESPVSSRIVGGGWWFFTLIIISSYTANLAAFLTVNRMKTPINGAEDLASQTAIEYGTLDSGASKSFFKNSASGTFQRMFKFMEDRDTFKPSVQEGVDAVRASENYAFLLESTMNEYHNQQLPCNTHRIGNTLNSKNYGIATPSGSYLLNQLTVAILVLMERGYISERKSFWWYEKGECQYKTKSASNGNATSLEIGDVWGVFYILIGGTLFGMLVCFFEFMAVSIHQARRMKVPVSSVLCQNFSHCARSMTCSLGNRKRNPRRRQKNTQADQRYPLPSSLTSGNHPNSTSPEVQFYSSVGTAQTEEDLTLLEAADKAVFVQF